MRVVACLCRQGTRSWTDCTTCGILSRIRGRRSSTTQIDARFQHHDSSSETPRSNAPASTFQRASRISLRWRVRPRSPPPVGDFFVFFSSNRPCPSLNSTAAVIVDIRSWAFETGRCVRSFGFARTVWPDPDQLGRTIEPHDSWCSDVMQSPKTGFPAS
ncbi:hypothetical protein CCHR01_06006 [Colletotrichum chrysophilum]|uniref:Uncharacterized protein n=1 Tax=Colletotrichum chrysophilum TaxID=1836956 RepID=A0AAD9APS8_9PEZI|nr:hypothetical protein CCHR01_06006 [Colletotrichum chrysophilum]